MVNIYLYDGVTYMKIEFKRPSRKKKGLNRDIIENFITLGQIGENYL